METLFIKLPLFTLVNIISRLSDEDKTNFALTNKQWFQVMVENKWNGQFMRISDTILTKFPNLNSLGMTLKTIPEIILKSVFDIYINGNQPIKSLLSLKNITHLTFNKDFNQLVNALKELINLTVLTFGDEFNQTIDALSGLDNLTTLKFGNRFNQSIEPFQGLPNLNIQYHKKI